MRVWQGTSLGECLMNNAEIVRHPNQIHARLESMQARSRVSRFAREARQPFAKGAIQPLDKGGIQDLAATRPGQQMLRSFQQPMCHRSSDLHNALFLRPLDNGANVQVWPDLQARSAWAGCGFDLLAKRAANTARICWPAIGQDQERAQPLGASANLLKQGIGQALVSVQAHRSSQPQSRRHHHAKPIHAAILRPLTRISSAFT